MSHGCVAVTVYEGSEEEYVTFISKEANDPEHEKNLLKIVEAFQQKLITYGSGWYHYRCMIGLEPTDKRIFKDKIFNIDDFTDDFDYPLDYDTWMAHRNKKNWFIIQKYTILDVLEYIKKTLYHLKHY